MIAFHVAGRPVYRYGIFYGITFLAGYLFLGWVGRQSRLAPYPHLQKLLTSGLDQTILWIIIGILVGGRLGHVFIYERAYYSQHLSEIVQTRQGGMSFIGGVIGVIVVLIGLTRQYHLSRQEVFLLGDLVLCVVPLGILLGRIGNYLNRELYGIIVSPGSFRDRLGLARDYGVDPIPTLRIATNLLQSFGEGFLLLCLTHLIFRKLYTKKAITPGRIVGAFFIGYAIVRFFVEYLKELAPSEIRGPLSVSQWIMIVFFGMGLWFVHHSFLLQSPDKSLGKN